MNATEHVMAILCAPLSGRELLNTEKSLNVFIMRMLELDKATGFFAGNRLVSNLINAPMPMMFVFGRQDAIVVRTSEDRQEVYRRLSNRAIA